MEAISLRKEELLEVLTSDRYIDAFVRYLAAYRVVEANYGLFDKLARPRDVEDFARAVYESVRVLERVLRRLKEGLARGEYKLTMEGIENVDKLFRVGRDCINRVLELAKHNPRLVGSVVASLALAYEGIQERG